MSLLEGLAAHLAAAGIGTYRGDGSVYLDAEVGICLEYQPETPDTVITLTSYPGATSDSKLGMDSPRVQARIRAPQQGTSADLAQAVYDELHGLGPVTLTDAAATRLLLCVGLNGVYYLGRDDSQRHQYVANYTADVINRSTHRE